MDDTFPKTGADDVTTLLRASFDPSPSPAPFRLLVVEGPDANQSFLLDGSQPSRVLVGQSPACAIRLSDRTVSRRHVGLDVTGRQARITDLGSTNGTYVNGVRVYDAVITGGELIQIGNTSFKLEYDTETSPFRVPAASHFGSMVGCSTEMRRLYPLCERLAKSDVSVLIEGEPGTGKEYLAEVLHEEGPRGQQPFVVFDCASVPSNLIDAELFGHEAGSLPGLPHARLGVLRQAHGGTLFIDEVGELDPSAQAKLLRALERAEVVPVGSSQPVPIDVRVITATRRDLDREVQGNRFRDDLLQRLAVTRIELPPLRQRRGDIPLLVRQFCEELGGDPQVLNPELGRWEEHSWPGNVRELRNTVARHLALGELAGLAMREAQQPEIPEGDFIDGVLELTLGEARQKVVEEFERRYVERMLSAHGGNVTRAAESAGVARRYFQILKRRSKERQIR